MAWLADLDAKSRRWPTPARWGYAGLKWALIVLGAYGAIGLAYTELSAGKPALGTGIAVAVVLAVVKGVFMAVQSARPDQRQSD